MSGARTSLFLRRATGAITALTALLVAVVAFSGQLGPVKALITTAYCQVFECPPPPPPPGPTIRTLNAPNVVGRDGGGSASGTMSGIKVSFTDDLPGAPDKYTVQWAWTGSGGTQHGSQTVIVDLLAADGSTVQSLQFPVNRDHCYYPEADKPGGNPESHSGDLSSEASLITSVAAKITEVVGEQNPC